MAWKLGLMPAEEYQKAASVESIRGKTAPAGQADPTTTSRYDRPGSGTYPLKRNP